VLLTCPTCRSGLQVPDGTTAMVRCPACKTVFSPAAGLAPPEPEPEDEEPKRRKRREDEDDDDEKPRKKKSARDDTETSDAVAETENRDFEPGYFDEKPKTKRRRSPDDDDSLTPAERAALKAAFARGAIGCKLILLSLALYMLALTLIIIFWFHTAFTEPNPAYIIGAGAIGLINWIVGAIGVGLCLSGPVAPGHWRFGIAAAVATALHLILLAVLAGQGRETSPGREADPTGPAVKWGLLPTRLDAVTFYLTLIIYQDEDIIPKGEMRLSIVVGVLEMMRNVLILMLISSLARAAGDEDLAHRCTRGAGFACFGPGTLALCMLLFSVAIIETNAQTGTFAKIIFTTVRMGTYAILLGTLFPGLMAVRETADACDEPFQSSLPKL